MPDLLKANVSAHIFIYYCETITQWTTFLGPYPANSGSSEHTKESNKKKHKVRPLVLDELQLELFDLFVVMNVV